MGKLDALLQAAMSVLLIILAVLGGLAVLAVLITLVVFALVGRAFVKGMTGR